MNDFTKEELQQLYALCWVHEHKCVSPLRTKLQSMIDNYCEHEHRAIDIGEAPIICKTCGKVVG